MQSVRCVILEHRHRNGRHFDWLFERPDTSIRQSPPLWAARITRPPQHWRNRERLIAERLADHRRVYFMAQGPLTRGRGLVWRVEAGWVEPLLWRTGRLVLGIDFASWTGRAELRPLTDTRWRVQLRQNPSV